MRPELKAHFALAGTKVLSAGLPIGAGRRINTADRRISPRGERAGVGLSAPTDTSFQRHPTRADPLTSGRAPGSLLRRGPVRLPVPSGLFHPGHVPGDRPCRRAGYMPLRALRRDDVTVTIAVAPLPFGCGLVLDDDGGGVGRIDQAKGAGAL